MHTIYRKQTNSSSQMNKSITTIIKKLDGIYIDLWESINSQF